MSRTKRISPKHLSDTNDPTGLLFQSPKNQHLSTAVIATYRRLMRSQILNRFEKYRISTISILNNSFHTVVVPCRAFVLPAQGREGIWLVLALTFQRNYLSGSVHYDPCKAGKRERERGIKSQAKAACDVAFVSFTSKAQLHTFRKNSLLQLLLLNSGQAYQLTKKVICSELFLFRSVLIGSICSKLDWVHSVHPLPPLDGPALI